MGFLWFGKKRDEEVQTLSENVKTSFDGVKQDFRKIADWITHLNSKDNEHDGKISDLNTRLNSLESEVVELRTFISFFSNRMSKQLFKQEQTPVGKQTAVEGVQTRVQTAVQTAILGNLSVMERAIVWVLLNNNDPTMKMSCEDIAALLNKDKSTIRGQLNAIKNKSDILAETIEKNGKKRYHVPESAKEILLSKIKAERKQKVVKTEE
jgi:predicted transcriptional regulator